MNAFRRTFSLTAFCMSILAAACCQDVAKADDEEALRRLLESVNVKEWTYSELEKEAELIVIATLRSQEKPAAEIRYDGDFDRSFVVVSTCDVAAVVKGSLKESTMAIVHLHRRDDVLDLSNTRYPRLERTRQAPNLVKVALDGKESFGLAGTREITPTYLLFLKRRSDGRFSLASGDQNGAASVRMLSDDVDEHVAK